VHISIAIVSIPERMKNALENYHITVNIYKKRGCEDG
jgi:hypothetical protein